jgi:homoprotocatechuate degradation regulator HpaR
MKSSGKIAPAEPAPATRQLPVLLHRTREALGAHFRKVFILHNLTDPQWRVLRILSESEEFDVTALARRSYLMGPSLSRILRDLAARELIVRKNSSTDARRFFHALTPKGRRLLSEVSPAFNPIYKEIERRFSVDRIERLNEGLAELLKAVQIAEEPLESLPRVAPARRRRRSPSAVRRTGAGAPERQN